MTYSALFEQFLLRYLRQTLVKLSVGLSSAALSPVLTLLTACFQGGDSAGAQLHPFMEVIR